MKEYKIVLLGSVGAGKSTAIKSIAKNSIVSTDVKNTDPSIDKELTTVAMDYGDINLPNGDRLRVFGTPGQDRFDFIWPILLSGALGAIVLVDATRGDATDEIDRYLNILVEQSPRPPFVVGMTKLDVNPGVNLEHFQAHLEKRQLIVPMMPVDARSESDVLMLLDALVSEIESIDITTNQ